MQQQTIDEPKAHALALAANDELIEQAVRDGRLTPQQGAALKHDDTARIRALIDAAITTYYARQAGALH